ncbi:MAG: TonB-dependent receptor [Bernardetiaceae bacterium]|nr:TonB-dependent receptor [Bernardetiaceae bacterium]
MTRKFISIKVQALMLRTILFFLLLFSCSQTLWAQDFKIQGKVIDKEARMPLTGATVNLEGTDYYAVTGLDGSFRISNVPIGKYSLKASYVSYSPYTLEIHITDKNLTLNIELLEDSYELDGVEVVGILNKDSESSARNAEKYADNVMNVMSSEAIEVSPDITVANVVQRMSGLTIERNNNGDGQYAIVRGMNKRYNYTLVNGIKIPSPDNENRYIPLDIFPAELLDRLVVSKSLTPSMEGDAIGGVVDMKMKDAPAERLFAASITTGYSELFMNRDYDYFNPATVDRTTPMQRVAAGERVATLDKYSTQNFNFEQRRPMPNLFGSLTYGDRFLNDKLGVVVAGSYQNSFRGADRIEFGVSDNTFGNPLPRVTRYQERRYSIQQERAGVHNKIDYKINNRHKLSLYNVFLHLQNNETRVIWEDELRNPNEPTLENNWRGQVNIQQIYNTTLQGEHEIAPKIAADWSLVYSYARQNMPDNSQLVTVSNYNTEDRSLRWLIDENFIRIWEDNSDQDWAAYYNLLFNPTIGDQEFFFKAGGLYRMKRRNNNFDLYTFKPNPGVQEYVPFETNFEDITWRITGGAGTPSHVLNYQSYEDIFASYGEFRFTRWNTQFLGGVRAEHTNQGYSSEDSNIEAGSQIYWRLLPSIHIKHMPTDKINVRASYFKSLSRPSFLEIVPYRRPATEEIRPMGGNPNLVPVDAHNLDMRFEYFPTAVDQILIGAFYKVINNPIEVAIVPPTDPQFPSNLPPSTTMIPLNLEMAINRGIEIDVIKYFNKFGIRANYTFTDSEVESVKRTRTRITEENYDQLSDLQKQELNIGDSTLLNVMQRRPLQGQSAHIANLSLLYKDIEKGWDAQLAMVYTGERIAVVSTGLDTDWWQRAFVQLDFSIEKRFKNNLTVFCKVNNLLDTPFEMYIKKPHLPQQGIEGRQTTNPNETLVQRDFFQRSYLLGLKYKL